MCCCDSSGDSGRISVKEQKMMFEKIMNEKNIRKAELKDLSRIAEILVFAKRIKYRSIFNNDDYSFNELQVVKLVEEYGKPKILDNIWVYDDGIGNC